MKLARFEYKGSSKGWWLVRNLPGITIFKSPSGWVIDDDPSMLKVPGGRGEEVWGKNFQTVELKEDFPAFSTRKEAIERLEDYTLPGKKPEAVIGEIIS